MKAKYLLYIVMFCSVLTAKAQSNWQAVQDTKTGIEFKMPPNIIMSDTLLTTLYAAEIDTASAVQVNVLDSARFDSTETLYNEALLLENGDTLRAIARIMLFAVEGTATSVNTIYTNGIEGLELGMQYATLQNPNYFYSFIRYYLFNGRFFAFTYTETQPKSPAIRNFFFNSIKLQ